MANRSKVGSLLEYLPTVLRDLRLQHGDTQQQLAAKLHMDYQRLSKVECGYVAARTDIITGYIDTYDVSLAQLEELLVLQEATEKVTQTEK